MPTKIERLVIFGDSMSDIGNKRVSAMGRFARALKLMRTNDAGRFSDRKNWTDFIWEWSGGATMFETGPERARELTLHHRSLTSSSRYGTPPSAGFSYVNYAQGGAMGASDRSAIGLGTFKEQCAQYLGERAKLPAAGNTLHLVWFGLNDLVTNGRDKLKMKQVAVEMCGLCEDILTVDRAGAHFLFVNLPNPQGAVRFMSTADTEKVRGYQTGAFEFNFELARQISIFQAGRADLVDMYTPVEHVNENLSAYGLRKGAQPRGVRIDYSRWGSVHPDSNWTTTSDGAHPSEAVYQVIANVIAQGILQKHDLGLLRRSSQSAFEIRRAA